MAWENDTARAKAASIGSEGYFRLEPGEEAHFLVNTDVGPYYREQTWPQGGNPIVAPQGSGLYPEFAEIVGWQFIGGAWIPKMIDAPLRQVAAIIEACAGVAGRVLKIKKTQRKHPTNTAWRVVSYTAEVVKEGVRPSGDTARSWPLPKGRPFGAQPPTQPVHSPTHAAVVEGSPFTPPPASTDDMPF